MRGFRVERLFGRDCHGIPIEQKVMSKHGIAVNRDIEEKI
jgi:isoleucyl-tRNA synthetase